MKTTFKNFSSPNEVKMWITKFKTFFPTDLDEDKTFLKALDLYTASANPIFNNYLRYNTELEKDDYIYPSVQKMISKLPTYHIPDNIVVYRYISKGLLKAMCPSYPPKRNMILQDKGFMSTTLIRESVDSYRSKNLNILLEISVPAGTKGTYVGLLSYTLPEYEVILAPNTKLRIDNKVFNHYFLCTVVE